MFASVVIPVHNEQENLPILMRELDRALEAIPEPIEILFVNDCSTDASPTILDGFQTERSHVRVIHLAGRGGQTGCYQVAFNEAQGEHIIRLDSDLQDDPADLVAFVHHLREGCDLVMGLRTLRKHRRVIRAVSIFYDSLMVLLFDSPLYTNTSSFVAFRAEHVRGIAFKKNDHRYLPMIAMHRGATKTKEVVIASRERRFGQSKYKNVQKVVRGAPEVTAFVARMLGGYYDRNRVHSLPKIAWFSNQTSSRTSTTNETTPHRTEGAMP